MAKKKVNTAVTTSSGTSDHNTDVEAGEYKDVSHLNVRVMYWYITQLLALNWHEPNLSFVQRCRRWIKLRFNRSARHQRHMLIAERREMLLSHLWAGLPMQWQSSRVLTEWMPLSIYRIVERNFVRILGTPYRLFEAGFIGGYESKFGGVWVRVLFYLFLGFLRFIVSLDSLYSWVVPKYFFKEFNKNKKLVCLSRQWNRVELQTTYRLIKGKGVRICEPFDDMLSYLYWVPGMVGSGGRFWGIKPMIRHLLVEVDLIALLRDLKEFITEEIEVVGNCLHVDGKVVAIVTHLRQQEQSPHFTIAVGQPDGSMTRPGWNVWEDIVVHTPPTDLHPEPIEWIVLRKDTYCCAEAGCSISAYEINAGILYGLPFKFFSWFVGLFQSRAEAVLGKRVDVVDQLIEYQQKFIELQNYIEVSQRASLFRFPNDKMRGKAYAGMAHREKFEEPVVLVFDLEGSTAKGEAAESEEDYLDYLEQYYDKVFEVILPYERSIRAPEGEDEVVAIWNTDTGDGAAVLFVGGTAAERLHVALTVAWELHEKMADLIGPDGEPFKIRVGIEQYGNTTFWSRPMAPWIIMGSGGKSLPRANRYQSEGKTDPLKGVRTTLLRLDLAKKVMDRWVFDLTKIVAVRLRGIEGTVELVRVVGPKVTEGE